MMLLFAISLLVSAILAAAPNPALFPPHTPSYLPVENDTIIYIGTAQAYTISPTATNTIEENLMITFRVWEKRLNERGGITVNGVTYNVSIVAEDVGSTNASENTPAIIGAKLDAIWRKFCNNSSPEYGRIDFLLAPYSSTYTTRTNIISNACKKISVSGGAAASSVYECVNGSAGLPRDCRDQGRGIGARRFDYCYGTRGLSRNYLPQFLTAMKIKQARTVAMVYEDNDFSSAVAVGVRDAVVRLNMRLLMDQKIVTLQTATVNASYAVYAPLIPNISSLKPDVVLSCGYTAGCTGFMQAAYDVKYAPRAYASTICLSDVLLNTFTNREHEYFSGPSGWDVRLFGPGFDEDPQEPCNLFVPPNTSITTARYFASIFESSTEFNPTRIPAGDQGVSHIPPVYVIHKALLDTQSFDPAVLVPYINTMKILNTPFGGVDFDAVGANVGKEFLNYQIVQIKNETQNRKRQTSQGLTLEIITPLSAATVDPLWPIPTWEERVFQDQYYLKLNAEKGIIAVASFFIACTVILMIAIAILRNKPQIKAASFIFCEIILFGALLVYISFYFWTVFTYSAFCNLQIWFFIMGYDILMGSLLAKNLRLLYIFYHAMKLRKVRPIETWHLLLAIAFLMAIDAIVIIVYEAAFRIKVFRIVVDPLKPANDYILCGTYSGSDYIQTAFIATLGALKALLLLVSIVIMIAVRKQPSEFNEAKAIAFAIYNQAFCIIALLAIWLVIDDINYSLKYILRSIVVLWGCAMTIFVIFGRKMYYVAIGKNKPFHGATSYSGSSHRETNTGKETTGSSASKNTANTS